MNTVAEVAPLRPARTIEDARRELGLTADATATGGELAEVRVLLAAIDERLAAAGMTGEAQRHQAALERLRRRFDDRFEALARVHESIVELRTITSPAGMLARAPAALCEGTSFTRAILSAVRGSTMVPEAVSFSDDPAGARRVLDQLRAGPVRLEHPLIETDVLRRRRAMLVVNAGGSPRVERRMAELMGWTHYACAPLLAGQNVIGIIHADRGPGEPLVPLDRDVLWEFAAALSRAHESASLRRTLQHEGDQLHRFLEWLDARSGALTEGAVTFASTEPAPLISSEQPAPTLKGHDDRLVFAGLLTKRELDVLRLLIEGGTNRTIADGLVLSETTVKFHINSILRKLHAANRAEAVARYLSLVGVPPP
jgi:LuxR family transcriptional regulator, regulator of acetate metabolism